MITIFSLTADLIKIIIFLGELFSNLTTTFFAKIDFSVKDSVTETPCRMPHK